MEENNKGNIRIIIIVVGLLIICVGIGYFIFKNIGLSGSHKNTTGLTGYKDSDVTFSCSQSQYDSVGNRNITSYIDVLANKDGYAYQDYTKFVYEYSQYTTIPDDAFCKFIKDIGGSKVISMSNDCGAYKGQNTVDLGLTNSGWDSVLTRSGNTITFTYRSIAAANQKMTRSEITQYKNKLESSGYTCH